jgi:nucleoside-diphosphate-sugar epimerase
MIPLLKHFDGKNVLITGGAGCIGHNLTEILLSAKPAEITILDDLSSAYEWNIPKDPRVSFIKGSILDDESLDTAFSSHHDYVFHLAAHFANQNSIEHPETDLLVNGMGVLKVLRRSHIARTEKFVFASSGCSVYGSEAPLPLTEDYVSLHLDTPYQITKLLGELYCNFYHDFYNLPVVLARFFNVYGPGEVPGRYRNVIPNFIYHALKGEPLPITGTGEETRDWTYVTDIVDGILRCATNPKAVGEAFNLASGTETRVDQIAKTINDLTNNQAGTIRLPRRDWDKIVRRRASIDKASRSIGYEPKTTIQQGIQSTVKWINSNITRIDREATM